jgi:hypothetical protein
VNVCASDLCSHLIANSLGGGGAHGLKNEFEKWNYLSHVILRPGTILWECILYETCGDADRGKGNCKKAARKLCPASCFVSDSVSFIWTVSFSGFVKQFLNALWILIWKDNMMKSMRQVFFTLFRIKLNIFHIQLLPWIMVSYYHQKPPSLDKT